MIKFNSAKQANEWAIRVSAAKCSLIVKSFKCEYIPFQRFPNSPSATIFKVIQ